MGFQKIIDKYYVGSTSLKLNQRLIRHLSVIKVFSIKV